MAARIPPVSKVLAIGGGVALDAGKYAAWKKDIPVILIPTVVSTGSVFQPFAAPRNKGKLARVPETGKPECVLFDTELIRGAPPYINTAGMGECICHLSQVSSWRWWSNVQKDGPVWNQAAVDEALDWVKNSVGVFSSDLDSEGRPGFEAIKKCAEANRERRKLKLTGARGLDHYIDPPFGALFGRSLLHGEAVALGTLITCYLNGSLAEEAAGYLRACRTRFKPKEIGCTWDEVYKVLEGIPAYQAEQRLFQIPQNNPPLNYLNIHPIDRKRFEEVVAFVEAS